MGATSISAPAERGQPRRRARGGSVRALVRRDCRITFSYRTALVSDLAFGFLNLAAYYFISRTLRVRVGRDLGGAPDYFAFAAVGVALSVVLLAAITGVARRVREEQLTGTLEALLVQPISGVELAFGLAGFPFLFAVARALAYLLLGGAFLGLDFGHCDWLGLLASFAASGIGFAALGVALAALVIVFKRADTVGSIGIFGLSLLGGALFPPEVLPTWLHPLSYLVPTRYAFAAVRSALFGTGDWVVPVVVLIAIGTVTMAFALLLFAAAIRQVVKRGTLNQY